MKTTEKIILLGKELPLGAKKLISKKTGLTEKEAQDYCSDPETSSRTFTSSSGKRRTKLHGPWFDGYTKM